MAREEKDIYRIISHHIEYLYIFILIFAYFFFSIFPANGFAADPPAYQQLDGVLDTRTQFSDGIYTVDGLAKMAQDRGIQVLFINDHDKVVMSYGVPPFPNIINKTIEMTSILKGNPEEYLQAVRQAAERYKNVIVIPGTESTPFYFWTGSPFKNNLTAHNHERRILTVGLTKADDYRRLPVVHNTGVFNIRLLPPVIPFLLSFLLAAVMIIWRGWLRIAGIVLAVVSLLFIIDSHPFRASVFDPFHGDQGVAPHQALIDYVHARGGLTFWNYPETQSGVRKLGPIHVSTKPYPEMILESRGYTGFAALYGDAVTLTEPGNLWDVALKEYCKGYRPQPPWGVATADYHKEGESGEKFGNYQTVFLVKEKSKEAVLRALATGKMYARQGNFPKLARLDEFSIRAPDGRRKGVSGDTIMVKGNPQIRIAISMPSTAPQETTSATSPPTSATIPMQIASSASKGSSTIPTPSSPALSAAEKATGTAKPFIGSLPAASSLSFSSPASTPQTGSAPSPKADGPSVKVRLIRNGAMIAEFSGPLPLKIDYEDPYYQKGEKVFYRMDMEGGGKIVANPIFVVFE